MAEPKSKKIDYASPIMAAFGVSPQEALAKNLHSASPTSPRGLMGKAIASQSVNWPESPQEAYESTPISEALLSQRNQGFPRPQHPALGGSPHPAYSRSGQAYVSPEIKHFDEAIKTQVAQFGQSALENHEMEHAHRQPARRVGVVDHTREVGPAVGDLVFRAEQFAREQGKPLQHVAGLPGGKRHDINWMRDQAKKHGYLDGRSMTDLIFNTTEGKQWYKQMVDGEQRRIDAIFSPPELNYQPEPIAGELPEAKQAATDRRSLPESNYRGTTIEPQIAATNTMPARQTLDDTSPVITDAGTRSQGRQASPTMEPAGSQVLYPTGWQDSLATPSNSNASQEQTMVYPQNPATTNIPNKPLTMRDRTYAAAKKSGGRLAEQINGIMPDVRGAIQYMADNPSSRIGADRPFKETQQPVSPLTQGAQQSPIAAALSGPGPGSDASRLTAPTQGIPRGLTGDVPTDMAPGRPSGADFPRYQPSQSQQMPGDASQLGMRNPLPAPGMDIPGSNISPVTPEGTLADRIAGMSMQPDPAYVQEQMEAAQALGQQRYTDSDVARMQSGRMADMTANRNMGQMAGGDYADMDPARAAASSQAMYRNAGTGGGLGGASMGAREDALEQAERANPPGPSYQQRFQNSSQEIRSIAEALQPGQTVSSTSADGTPMLASRGNAQAREGGISDEQRIRNRGIRQERRAGLRNAGQMRLERNAAMQEAAANPENSPFFQALMMQNPFGAAAITQARGATRNAEGELKRRAEADRMTDVRAGEANVIAGKQADAQIRTADGNIELANSALAQEIINSDRTQENKVEELRQLGMSTEAAVKASTAEAGRYDAETAAITAASDPEAQAAAQRNAERMAVIENQQGGEYVDDIMTKPGETSGERNADGSYKPLKPPRGSGPNADITDEDIKRRISQLSENEGLSGDELHEALIASGLDNERLRRFSNDNDFGLRSDIGSLWSVLKGKSPDAIRREQRPFNDIFGRYRQ